MGDYTFNYSRCLDEVIIPKSVQSIGEDVFKWSSIKRLAFRDGIQVSLNKCSFLGCKFMEIVVIPSSITEIDDDIFNNSHSDITIITTSGSEAEAHAIKYGIKYQIVEDTDKYIEENFGQ